MSQIRVGQPGDADAVADVQYRAWSTSCADILPADAMSQVNPAAAALRWRESMLTPPSPSHRVLIGEEAGAVAGFAAIGPARDEDEAAGVGEIYITVVDPAHDAPSVGKDLVSAAVDHLRGEGFTHAVAWLLEEDAALQSVFVSAGWKPDDGRRLLDMGRPVPEIRLRVTL